MSNIYLQEGRESGMERDLIILINSSLGGEFGGSFQGVPGPYSLPSVKGDYLSLPSVKSDYRLSFGRRI